MELLKSLNKEQREAVEYNAGPHMIVAGAGSGKTRVLTYKIAYIIDEGLEPENILALTFTNKAAKEMKERIAELIGDKAQNLWMGTFHSIFARILRSEAHRLNYKPNFSIYDREDSVSLVGNILTELNLSFDNLTPNNLQHKISYYKNHMITVEDYLNDFAKTAIEKRIGEVYKEYQIRLFENNSMDFDDLLLKPIELFNHHPNVIKKYRSQFKYILVDEYQDTNKAQYEIIKILGAGRTKVCVVGDDAQSIYGWRGAELSNMLDFEKDFPKSEIFRLQQNYRSTKTILKASDSVIANNKDRIKKELWTENEEGDKLSLIRCADEKDEAYQISKLIKKEITTRSWSC